MSQTYPVGQSVNMPEQVIPSVTTEQHAIPSAMAGITDSLGVLESVIADLHPRLRPLLKEPDPTGAEHARELGNCEMAERLHQVMDRIYNASWSLRDILNRLEI